jgi:hypothetical protein
MSTIKSYKGKITKGTIEKIHLSTNDGLTGYRIKQFSVLPSDIESGSNESAVKIFSTEQSSTNTIIDFSDSSLLAVAMFLRDQATVATTSDVVIFDNETFNQDIFITYDDGQGSATQVNYYLELEQFKLDLNSSTYHTLKNIRSSTQ